MAAIPSFAFPDVDASQLDDKMDVASSPFRQHDDLDIDLDSIRDPSVVGSPLDDMVDDPAGLLNTRPDTMEDQPDETLLDDDMNDEQNVSMLTEQPDLDYNMDASIEEAQGDEDEDILYEDDEDIGMAVPDTEGTAEYDTNKDQPRAFEEVEANVILEEPADQPEQQDHTDIGTNQFETFSAEAPVPVAEDAAQDQGETRTSRVGTPGTSQEYPRNQAEEGQAPEREQGEQRDDAAEPLEQHQSAEADDHAPQQEEGSRRGADSQATVETNESGPKDQRDNTAKTEDERAAQTVHPVTLVYLEEEMSLFPPMLGDASSVYFLPDASLAFEPLDRLLAACREILTGTLDHHDELVLDVPGLGLHICEDSKYAAQITLSQILDVYLRLCNNDAGQVSQPLYCHLSSRVSLASQYAYLCSAEAEGKTYAEIAADHLDSPELQGDDAGEDHDYHEHQNEGDQSPANNETKVIAESTDNRPPTARVGNDHHHLDTFDEEEQAEDDIFSDHATRGTTPTVESTVPVTANADHPEAVAVTEAPETAEQVNLLDRADQQDDEPEDAYEETREPENSGTGQGENPEAEDKLYEGQEHETNSSHTVEADSAGTDLQDIDAADVEARGLVQFTEEAEDLFHHGESGLEPETSYEPYEDEELFVAQDEYGEGPAEDVSAPIQEDLAVTLQNAGEPEVPETQTLLPINAESSGEDTLHPASADEVELPANLSPPQTPVKGTQAKRKAEDDDELLLDLDTPDTKRRRPS
ncbi:uncharacterized protein Z519_09339 [Cladophialophora bantiana CBS 173.52]|uniref:Uncharacterized protein n=1 Tax=Cladophialophora bantiana (strain ATCC 10958 / CBS 173.52 / CDC B-1940 / NIH 8579) TaxID=1442370 RepID=A0A0D2HGJ3_CLAB1|nr:uncharacterized protein Z519_09339 [Cladophialophora bantiana CBS 173.52]KIW89910.1 hypothetical protein Z519_09339 [Cladophialophora bantiana CBS 173.52]